MPLKNKQLIIFIKAPIAGQCKTRLMPFLSAEQARDFYQSLVETCFVNITPLNDIDIAIYTYPDINHPFVNKMSQTFGTSIALQQGNDLGERMHHAIQCALQQYKLCVLIGTDCPDIDKEYINNAFKSLNQHDMVFGPAEDGGYVLIGANRIQPRLFDSIEWSSEKVLQQSLNNCNAAQYSTHLLNTLADIDTPEDYIKYQQA